MTIKVSTLLITTLIFIQSNVLAQKETAVTRYVIENFENEKLGDLPSRWYNRDGNGIPADYPPELKETYHYRIKAEQGNRFLRFEGKRGKHLTFPLIDKKDVNIKKTPVLSWKWRIHNIPVGANENNDDANDAAASIYVAFDMGRVALIKKVPKTIRYTWSSTLPVGTELSKFYGNQKIVVVGTGNSETEEWMTFERNIVEDYKRLFGDSPPEKPIGILILSDGNNTEDIVKADYDDIILKASSDN